MKPYSRRSLTRKQWVFNYRLSCGRCIVENAFGILAGRWQCLYKSIQLDIKTADREEATYYVVPGFWRQGQQLKPLTVERGNRACKAAQNQRDVQKEYFCSPVGSVPWQDEHLLDY